MRVRLRKLHVGEREFTWRAEVRHSPGRLIRVRAWGAGRNGRALQADLTPRPPSAKPAAEPYPTAEDVTALIAWGLTAGWDPAATGGTFIVPAGAAVTLPTLRLVDPVSRADPR